MSKKKENIEEKEKECNCENCTSEDNELLLNRVKQLEESVLRSQAELINYRKRKDEETNKMLKYAEEDIILQLLPILDNFERAINMQGKSNDETNNFLEGFKLIYEQIKKVLDDFEVKEIDCLNKKFDPNFHHSVAVGNDDTKEKGIILEIFQKGYLYKDKVIRPSMVMINE